MNKSKELGSSEIEKQICEVSKQIHQLCNDLSVILPLIERLEDQEKQALSKRLTTESSVLMKSLLSLTS